MFNRSSTSHHNGAKSREVVQSKNLIGRSSLSHSQNTGAASGFTQTNRERRHTFKQGGLQSLTKSQDRYRKLEA